MKRNQFLSVIALILLAGCQQDVQNEIIDLKVIETEASSLMDEFQEAIFSKNLDALSATVADDALFVGSDPTEIWTKQEMLDLWKVYFVDSTFDTRYNVELRKIKVSADGHSAIIIQHATYPGFSQKLKVRQTFHMTAQDDNWVFDYGAYGVLFANEKIVKVMEALEME